MNDRSVRSLAKLAVLLALPIAAAAQAPQQAGTLAIAGQPDHPDTACPGESDGAADSAEQASAALRRVSARRD